MVFVSLSWAMRDALTPLRASRHLFQAARRCRSSGVVVFHVPRGVHLASLELHDSALSGGVTVDLS